MQQTQSNNAICTLDSNHVLKTPFEGWRLSGPLAGTWCRPTSSTVCQLFLARIQKMQRRLTFIVNCVDYLSQSHFHLIKLEPLEKNDRPGDDGTLQVV